MRYPIAALCLLLFVSFAVSAQDTAPPGQEHFDRGIGLIRDERFEEAIEAFRAAERLSPKEPAIPANIGQIYLRLGRPSDAIAPLRKAVTLEPSAPPFRIELCRALSLIKDHDAAIKECEKAVELDPQWDRAHSALFIARQAAGRPTEELLRTIDFALGLHRAAKCC
jgi:Flp pilus assembly protein TadD